MIKRITLAATMISVLGTTAIAQETAPLRSNAHIGFTYPLSTNGIAAPDYTNVISIHALAGVSKAEEAFCVAGVANVIRDSARGLVASGVVNVIGNNARGLQAAGMVNYTGHNVRGMQASGFINVAGSVDGMQSAGFGNMALTNVTGLQAAGFINVADTATTQAAGYINVAQSTHTQAAGFINVAERARGAQVAGFINIAEEVDGAQVAGFINIAEKVKGVQLAGFINIADSSDCPIGLINIIRNGEMAIGTMMNETGTTLFTFRSGGKKLYGIIGAGGNMTKEYRAYAVQAGLGMHIPVTRTFRFNAEVTVTTLSDRWWNTDIRSGVKIMPSVRLGCVEFFAGPSFNYTGSNDIQGVGRVGYTVWDYESRFYAHNLSIGAEGGVQFHLDSRKMMKKIKPEKNMTN
ncbi:hypothetical protein GCM10023093_06110 [Nemorincola caseinilytica]|uniref:Uncharacterized protein n=1 Tax=Nemorincola caseinilytica TaxID=2054315 RepID=A0ABP8N8H5_9BACT